MDESVKLSSFAVVNCMFASVMRDLVVVFSPDSVVNESVNESVKALCVAVVN